MCAPDLMGTAPHPVVFRVCDTMRLAVAASNTGGSSEQQRTAPVAAAAECPPLPQTGRLDQATGEGGRGQLHVNLRDGSKEIELQAREGQHCPPA